VYFILSLKFVPHYDFRLEKEDIDLKETNLNINRAHLNGSDNIDEKQKKQFVFRFCAVFFML
jgi:hypothetical protein